MAVRILLGICLIVLGAGFAFFSVNVIWLGTKEFFKIYGPKAKTNKNKQNKGQQQW